MLVTCCLFAEERSKRVGGTLGLSLQLRKSFLGNLDVVSSVGKIVVNLGADTALVQDVSDTSREKSKGGLLDLECGAGGITFVGEDGEVKSKVFCKGLLGLYILSRDSVLVSQREIRGGLSNS